MKFSDYYLPTQGAVGYGDKGTVHSYLDIYDTVLAPYKNSTSSVLEIGVSRGHSITILGKYFSKASVIGIDIMPELVNALDNVNNNITLITGDATKETTVSSLDNLDVVIDDGSHILSDQLDSFSLLWSKINPGGIYIIEDIANLESFYQALSQTTIFNTVRYMGVDLRRVKNRYDDVLFIAYK